MAELNVHVHIEPFKTILSAFLGADLIGINCNYDPETTVKTIKMMKEGLDRAGGFLLLLFVLLSLLLLLLRWLMFNKSP